MKTPVVSTLIMTAVGAAFLIGSPLHAIHPQMNEAIEQLEKARHSEHPIEHLEKAKVHLEEARRAKGGERADAIKQINIAIEDARKHEHGRMEEHITHAIKEIREAKEEGHRRR